METADRIWWGIRRSGQGEGCSGGGELQIVISVSVEIVTETNLSWAGLWTNISRVPLSYLQPILLPAHLVKLEKNRKVLRDPGLVDCDESLVYYEYFPPVRWETNDSMSGTKHPNNLYWREECNKNNNTQTFPDLISAIICFCISFIDGQCQWFIWNVWNTNTFSKY